jgi:hypothetical protein
VRMALSIVLDFGQRTLRNDFRRREFGCVCNAAVKTRNLLRFCSFKPIAPAGPWMRTPRLTGSHFRSSREKFFGASLEALSVGRDAKVSAFRQLLQPLRMTLRHQPFLAVSSHATPTTPYSARSNGRVR